MTSNVTNVLIFRLAKGSPDTKLCNMQFKSYTVFCIAYDNNNNKYLLFITYYHYPLDLHHLDLITFHDKTYFQYIK